VLTIDCNTSYFSSSSVVLRTFSVLCVYSTFRHHPRLPGYLCAKFFSVVTSTAEVAHGEKPRIQSITQSLSHPAYLMPQETKLHNISRCILRISMSHVKVMASRSRSHKHTQYTLVVSLQTKGNLVSEKMTLVA